MKVVDIEVGREYVYGRSTWLSRARRAPDRVRIKAKNATDPHGRKKWNYNTQQNEPVVHALLGRIFRGYNNYMDPGRDEAISAAEVIEPWEDYQTRRDEEERSVSARAEDLRQRKEVSGRRARELVERINAALGTRLELLVFPAGGGGLNTEDVWNVTAICTEDDLETLAGLVGEVEGREAHDEGLRIETEGKPR